MATRYGSRYQGFMSLQRFLVVERYYECQRPVPAPPRRAPEPGDGPAAKRQGAGRTSGEVR
jgi:hypothetical protein